MKMKNVLVIGASSGLGRAASLQLAAKGANVIVSSRSSDCLKALKQEIEISGGSCHVHTCDICLEADVKQLIANMIDRVDQLDINEVDEMFQTNVVGIIRCTRYMLPHWYGKSVP